MDPNSSHQMWSHWTFTVREARHIGYEEVFLNVMKWLRRGFGSVGRAKVVRTILGWRIEAVVEGAPAHDPEYVKSVERGFLDFVAKGWGALTVGKVHVKLLAGSRQDGKPAEQWVELPTITAEGR